MEENTENMEKENIEAEKKDPVMEEEKLAEVPEEKPMEEKPAETPEEEQSFLSDVTIQDEPRWYVLQARARYEDTAITNLRIRIETFGLEDRVLEVMAPSRKRKRVRRGQTQEFEEKVYPGYIFVKAMLDKETESVICSTEFVKEFIGGTYPTPLTEEEIASIMRKIEEVQDVDTHITDLQEGDPVKIIDGPFSNMQGRVGEIDTVRGRVRVFVSMFGRDTPVDLEFFQIERVI